ncbi:hypothetical protein AXF42_Ash021032 [Apostasia shenzhenica]|uniref:Uncharacterized protein n=1 Tax=Apostasia shenzhenica TaxID=1088818 RepID=A0A2I0ADV5_9ASPA|nr:hypothetical protein AXF42_Ash021032 [Apostasia shenzhenica]
MAVRRNGMEENEEEEEGLFEEDDEAWAAAEIDVHPHLRPLADAAESGNVNALRLALDQIDVLPLLLRNVERYTSCIKQENHDIGMPNPCHFIQFSMDS